MFVNNNLTGAHLKIVGLAAPDYAYQLTLKGTKNGKVEFDGGYTYELLLLLQYSLNFTYEAIKGEGWPDLLPNGSWTGIGGQIISKQADLSIPLTTILPNRVKPFDLLVPTGKGGLIAIFQQPPSASVRNILTNAFPLESWIALFVTLLTIIGSIKVFNYFGNSIIGHENEKDSALANDAWYWVLVTLCQRDFLGSPESTSMRLLYMTCCLFCILIGVVFGAAIVSELSLEMVPIRKFGDLVNNEVPVYGDSAAPFTHHYVENIVKRRQNPSATTSGYLTVHDGVQCVLNRAGVFIGFYDAFAGVYKKFNLKDSFVCDKIYKLKVPGVRLYAGWMTQKGSGLKEILNPQIVRLHETGFVKRLTTHSMRELYPRCLHDQSGTLMIPRTRSKEQPLDFQDVSTAFVILLLGIFSSSIWIILEFWIETIKKLKKLKKKKSSKTKIVHINQILVGTKDYSA